MARTYPINLLLKDRLCVVIGGGEVAARKVRSLADAEARVRVIAPEFCRSMQEISGQAGIELIGKRFEPQDLDGAVLVIASTDDETVNRSVYDQARIRGIIVNVVDVPELCDFYVPSVVQRGDLTITISTGGLSPGVSREIRKRLEEVFGPEYAQYLQIVANCRETIRKRYPEDPNQRMRIMNRILDLDLLSLIRNGQIQEAIEEADKCI